MQRRRNLTPSPLVVTDSVRLTPNLIRMTLEGQVVADFPAQCSGDYIKFAFDEHGRPVDTERASDSITLRTYSIRALDKHRRRLTVDFVLHGNGSAHDGPASAFARVARPGDRIGIVGPGSVKSLEPSADWYLIVGDMTALPAIAAKLEERQARAGPLTGYVVIEVQNEADASCLDVPESLELRVILNPNPTRDTRALVNAVRSIPWRDGRPFVWCAAEFSRMIALRDYVRDERDVGLENRYISSYWMIGNTDEGHKAEKRRDAERENALG